MTYILQETGDRVLLEDGGRLLLESAVPNVTVTPAAASLAITMATPIVRIAHRALPAAAHLAITMATPTVVAVMAHGPGPTANSAVTNRPTGAASTRRPTLDASHPAPRR